MINSVSLIGFNFQLSIDFGFDVLFPHNFSVLHQNHIETSWFSLKIHEIPFAEEKSMLSSLDTSGSMSPPPILLQSASALSKKYFKTL